MPDRPGSTILFANLIGAAPADSKPAAEQILHGTDEKPAAAQCWSADRFAISYLESNQKTSILKFISSNRRVSGRSRSPKIKASKESTAAVYAPAFAMSMSARRAVA